MNWVLRYIVVPLLDKVGEFILFFGERLIVWGFKIDMKRELGYWEKVEDEME